MRVEETVDEVVDPGKVVLVKESAAALVQPVITRVTTSSRICTCLTSSSSQMRSLRSRTGPPLKALRDSMLLMPIIRRETAAAPIVVGSRRYTPVAGDTIAGFHLPGVTVLTGYARPLRIEVEDGDRRRLIRIPDRQLQIMLAAVLVAIAARLVEKGRNL